MTSIEVLAALFRALSFVLFYLIVGFGPGFVLGLVIANELFARGQPSYLDTHEENKKRAAQHNAQWTPSHERWQK